MCWHLTVLEIPAAFLSLLGMILEETVLLCELDQCINHPLAAVGSLNPHDIVEYLLCDSSLAGAFEVASRDLEAAVGLLIELCELKSDLFYGFLYELGRFHIYNNRRANPE